MKQSSPHRAKQIQIKELLRRQAREENARASQSSEEPSSVEPDYPKPAWWREDIHGASALAERQRQRCAGQLNRPKRGARCGFKDWQQWRLNE